MTNPESIHNRPKEIAEALGADTAIYIGTTSLIDGVTGAIHGRIRIAKEAREIAGDETKTGAVKTALSELVTLVDDGEYRNERYELTTPQKDAIADSIGTLVGVHKGVEQGAPTVRTLTTLFDAYFAHQAVLHETPAGHILRMIGDNHAIEVDYDFDEAWELYQQALQRHEGRGQRW